MIALLNKIVYFLPVFLYHVFIKLNIVNTNRFYIVITFSFDRISLIFMECVFFISSLVVLCRDYHINSFIYHALFL